MTPYSSDLRRRILADCDGGMTTPQVAAKYRVSASRVRRLKQRRRATGPAAPVARRHGPSPKRAPHAAAIAAAVRREPDAAPVGRRAALGPDLGISTPWRAIGAPGLTPEKSRRRPPSATGPTSPRRGGGGGAPRCPRRTRTAWSSSTRPGPSPP